MLDNNGFDLWANTYDKSVDSSDKDNTYPFAGYKKLMNIIYNIILSKKGVNILDIGIGTGILCGELYKKGYKITGIDFSDEMIKICREKMTSARLIKHDFTKGLPKSIKNDFFDIIICTYAMHHLDDDSKIVFIKELLDILDKKGLLMIGDIGFNTREELDGCRKIHENEWDNDEYYFIFDEIKNKFPKDYKIIYEQISICAGIIRIEK